MNTYNTQPQQDGLSQRIMRLVVSTIIPVFGLFLLRAILSSLPMVKNANPISDWGVTPIVLVKAAIDSVIYLLILRCCYGIGETMKAVRPHLAEMGTVILLAGCALVATLAYNGYESLVASLAPSQTEVYNWVFLGLVLAPIAVIVTIVTRRLDFFSNLVFGKLTEAVSQPSYANQGMQGERNGAPPVGPPPSAPAVSSMDAQQQMIKERLRAISAKASNAQNAADRLNSQGRLSSEVAESAAKIQEYLSGAEQCLAARDLDSAKGFADWAEYEAGRVLAAK